MNKIIRVSIISFVCGAAVMTVVFNPTIEGFIFGTIALVFNIIHVALTMKKSLELPIPLYGVEGKCKEKSIVNFDKESSGKNTNA